MRKLSKSERTVAVFLFSLAVIAVIVIAIFQVATRPVVQDKRAKIQDESAVTQEPAKPSEDAVSQSNKDAVFIKITKNGISSDASEVVIRNYRSGARAEMTYRIHNATEVAIMPEIYYNTNADVADYSKANGAIRVSDAVATWLEIPKLSEVPPGRIVDFTLALVMPKDAKKPADKIGFQVGVASKTEAKLQPAIGIWWIVSFR